MRRALVAAFAPLAFGLGALASACATGGSGGDSTGGDAQAADGTAPKTDGGAGCPTGYTGTGCKACAGGFHACGAACEQDHPNTPDAGCSQGCNGTACPAPANATAKCTSGGLCDFACNTSFDKSDGGCACPSGEVVCSGVCKQCCSDSDCVGHQLCTGGVCAGCQAGWGDCNSNASDGCETHLDSTSNCGSCGHSCCSGLCCGFLGLSGSESCKASGTSFSCGC